MLRRGGYALNEQLAGFLKQRLDIRWVPHRGKYLRKKFEELSNKSGAVFMTGKQILD